VEHNFHGEALMETLNLIYWYRVGFGAIAALISVVGWALTGRLFASVIEGISWAIIFYIITYYILKMKFIAKVEKTSKLFTQGIGAYFLTWIISWILILSIIISPTVPTANFVYSPSHPTVGETITFNATASYDVNGYIASYSWFFGDNTGQIGSNPVVYHNYTVLGNYLVSLYVTDDSGLVSSPRTAVVEVKNITG